MRRRETGKIVMFCDLILFFHKTLCFSAGNFPPCIVAVLTRATARAAASASPDEKFPRRNFKAFY